MENNWNDMKEKQKKNIIIEKLKNNKKKYTKIFITTLNSKFHPLGMYVYGCKQYRV